MLRVGSPRCLFKKKKVSNWDQNSIRLCFLFLAANFTAGSLLFNIRNKKGVKKSRVMSKQEATDISL